MLIAIFLLFYRQNRHVLDSTEVLGFSKASGNYASDSYVNSNKIQLFTYESDGDYSDHPLSLAFDNDNKGTYWVAKDPNTDTFHNSIFINFDKKATIEAILHDSAYSTKTGYREFHGFPLTIKIYTSLNDEDPLRLQATFSGEEPRQDTSWERTQFVFPNPILCKRMQIEFVEVTNDDFISYQMSPVAGGLHFIGNLVYQEATLEKAKNNYAVEDYMNSHRITSDHFTFETNGDKSDSPKDRLFDGNKGTYWTAGSPVSDTFKPTVSVNFSETTAIEGIIFSHAYSSSGSSRTYHGFATKLTIYSAVGDRPLTKDTVFEGELPVTTAWGDFTQFVFKSLVVCDKLQIEFTEVSNNTYSGGNTNTPVVGEIYLIKPETEGSLPLYPASGDLGNDNYVNTHKIPTSEFTYALPKFSKFTHQNQMKGHLNLLPLFKATYLLQRLGQELNMLLTHQFIVKEFN